LFNTVAIIVAAGQGSRMGAKINKQYLKLLDRPILAHTLDVFEQHPLIDGIIVVTRQEEIELCTEEVILPYSFKKVFKVIAGGRERQDSVYNGLKTLPSQCELVVVHDGARPLITPDIIEKTVIAARQEGAAISAVPFKDTVKRVIKGFVRETIPRQEVWAVQTPQAFYKKIILEAYEAAYSQDYYGTDDASLVEKIGKPVKIVFCSYENIKITTPEDLDMGKAILERRLIESSFLMEN